MPIGFPPDGLAGCARAGAEKASAAITATPVKRHLMLILLAVETPTSLLAVLIETEYHLGAPGDLSIHLVATVPATGLAVAMRHCKHPAI